MNRPKFSPFRRSLARIGLAGALLIFAAVSARASTPVSPEVSAKIGALERAINAKKIRHCRNGFILLRRIGNTCTRALDSLVNPVADAKAALIEEESRFRKLACPSVVDHGCDEGQIGYRKTADFLADAIRALVLTEEQAIADRREAEWWDRALVKDNRLSVIWARDFVGDALAAYARALESAVE